jgi:hypothetical protein
MHASGGFICVLRVADGVSTSALLPSRVPHPCAIAMNEPLRCALTITHLHAGRIQLVISFGRFFRKKVPQAFDSLTAALFKWLVISAVVQCKNEWRFATCLR